MKKKIYLSFLVFILSIKAFSQTIGTCPVTSYINYFDPACQTYIKTPKEIKLGQARVLMSGNPPFFAGRCVGEKGIDIAIPQNKPGWAIGLAHSHRMISNFMGGEYLSINHLFATSFQESLLMPNTNGVQWDATKWSNNPNYANRSSGSCNFAIKLDDGYFHTDANGRVFLTEMYPTRFPTTNDGAAFVYTYEANIHLALHWLMGFYRIRQYGFKIDMNGYFTNAADKYAATKMFAASYVKGQTLPDVTKILFTNRATTINSPDVAQYLVSDANSIYAREYAYFIAAYTKSLDTDGNLTEVGYKSTLHEWYDYQMTWQDVSDYIDKICPFYREVNCTNAKAAVKKVFDAQKGGAPISFRYEFSEVVDAITANFPYYEPEIFGSQFSDYKCNFACKLPVPTISYTTPLEFCEGLSVDLTTIVGTGYKYEWFKDGVLIPNSNSITYKATQSGVYKVKITDPKNCSLESVCNVTVKVTKCSSCNLTATATSTNVKCSGYGDGSILVNATGETGPYYYKVTGGTIQNSNKISNLKEGSYFITIYKSTDTTCKGFANATIKADNIIYSKIAITPTVTACDKADLLAKVTNNPPSSCDFTFERTSQNQWGDWPADILSVSLMANGTQELFNSSSRKVFSTTVTVPNGSQLSVVIKNIGISAGSSGSDKWVFNIKAPDGTIVGTYTVNPSTSFVKGSTVVIAPFSANCTFTQPNFTYTWSPANRVSSANTLATKTTVIADTYIKITAANPSSPQCPLIDSVLVKNTCSGSCTPPATAPLFKSANFSACAPVTGANLVVTLPTGVYYQLFNSTTDAAIGTVAGPTSAVGDVTISNVAAGTYKVRIASSAANLTATNCYTPSSATATVIINPLPIISVVQNKPNICAGDIDAKLTASVASGTATFVWDKIQNGIDFTATTSQDYKVTATDGNGCKGNQTYPLVVNDLPTITATASPSATVCNGTEVTLIGGIKSGTATYSWDDIAIVDNKPFIPLADKKYTVTGTDAKGCKNTAFIDIKLSSPPTATITTTGAALNYCAGTSAVALEANSIVGATYEWFKEGASQGVATTSNTISNATAGNWTVKVTTGCSATSAPVKVIENQLPNATATSRATALCLDDTVTLKGASSTPGVTYAWDNGVKVNNTQITLDNASKFKTYTLTVTSKENCTATTSITLTPKVATNITTPPAGFTACVGVDKTLTIAATGAGTLVYKWTLGTTTVGTNSPTLTLNNIQTTNAGTYKVSVTGDCGTLNADAVVVVNDKPKIDKDKQPTKSGGCVGSNAALNVTATGVAPLTYQWIKNPATNVGTNSDILSFTNLQTADAGIYQVKITNSCGTVISDTASITTPSNETPTVELLVSKARVCEGTTVQLTALVKQGGGNNPLFTFRDGLGNTLGTAEQTSTTFTTSALTTDQTYTVLLKSNSTCKAPGLKDTIRSIPVTVKVDTKPTKVSAGADKSICTTTYTLEANAIVGTGAGAWTVKSGTGNFTDFTQNNTTLSNLTVGANEYKWTVTNGVCTPVSDSVIITRTGSMSTPNAGKDIKICEGNTVNLSASTLQVGETGTWSTSPSTLTIANTASPISTISSTTGKSGTYSVKWTIGNGVCPDQADSLNLIIDQLPSTATLANATISTCATQLNLNADAPTIGTGVWNITSGSGNIAVADINDPKALLTGLSSGGTTTLTWSVKNGTCTQANSKTLTINQVGNLSNPIIQAGSNTPITEASLAICKNKTFSFTANKPAAGETGTWTSTSNAIVALSGNNQTQNLTITGTGVDTITWTISTTTPGCTPVSKQLILVISDVPTQPSVITGDDTLCANAVTTQSVTQVANTNYTWNLQNATGTSNTNAITATIGTGLQAVLTVTPSNTCGNGTARSKTITINSKPLAPVFTASNTTSNPQINPSKVCSQATVNYTVNTVAGETYTWSWKNPSTKTNTDIATGSISTNASNITKSETDTLIVTGTNNCGTGTSKKLAVSFNPLPSYTVPNDTVICQGNALPNLKLSFTGKPSYTVNFTFNGTPVSVTAPANTYLLPSQVGTYQLTSVTDANGCTNTTTSKTVTVSQTALPEASYTVTGQTVCEGKDANIQISGSESGILYNIYKKGTPRTKVGSTVGTGSAISSTITASNLTSTNIIEVEAVGCAAITFQDTASIKQVGTITAIIGKTAVCDNAKTQTYTLSTVAGATGYQWLIDKDATVTPKTNTSSATVTVGTNTNYTLTATAVLPTGACANSTASLAIAQIASFKGDTLVRSEDTVCAGASITVSLKNKTADVYRKWSFPLNTKINSVNLDSTLFNITLQEQGTIQVMPYHTCNTTIQNLQENVEVYKVPQAFAGANQKYNGFPTGVQLKGSNLASEQGVKYKYDWTVTKGNAVLSTPTALQTAVTPKEVETKYLLTITTPNKASCSSSSEVIISFEVVITPPLIFSPNEDGKNDLWEINELEFFPNASVEIFNQWGTMVYSKNGGYFAEPWNGKYDNGAEAPIATYYYIITPNKDGYNNKAGSVTIVK